MNAKSVRQFSFFTSIRTAVEMGFDSLPLSKKLFAFGMVLFMKFKKVHV